MAEYVELELVSDPEAMANEAKTYMEEHIDGFVVRPANVESVLIEAHAYMDAELIEQASTVSPYLFSWLGRSLFGIAPHEPEAATGTVTITFAADVSALLIAEGSLIAVPSPSGDQTLFSTIADVTSVAGGGSVDVGIVAEEPGVEGNGCFGTSELVEVLDGISSLVVTDPTAGGVDEEDEDDYLDRLASALTLLAPRPILPQDFAAWALQDDRVERAMAIDLLQPAQSMGGVGGPPWGAEPNGTTPVPRCITIAIKPVGAASPSSQLMTDIWTLLDSLREVNFLAYVIPPSVSTIEVQLAVKPVPGTPFANAQAACLSSLQSWLDPTTWGPTQTGQDWAVDKTVRINEAIDWANRADGVWYVQNVQIRVAGGSWQTTDLTMPGIAPLPVAGTITITQAP